MAIYFRFASLPELRGLSAADRKALISRIPISWSRSAAFVAAIIAAMWLGNHVSHTAALHGFPPLAVVLSGAATTGLIVYLYVLLILNTFTRKGLRHAKAAG
jgi:hypothetical protein